MKRIKTLDLGSLLVTDSLSLKDRRMRRITSLEQFKRRRSVDYEITKPLLLSKMGMFKSMSNFSTHI